MREPPAPGAPTTVSSSASAGGGDFWVPLGPGDPASSRDSLGLNVAPTATPTAGRGPATPATVAMNGSDQTGRGSTPWAGIYVGRT